MPEEILTTSTPEVITTPSNVDVDRGLEAALEKRFKNYTSENETQKEIPQAEPKAEEKPTEKAGEITIELKKPNKETPKESKSEEKHVQEDNKALPTPESLDESPTGKGQAAWNALKNNYKRSFKSIEAKDQEITKLKASLAEKTTVTQKETETFKSQIEELSRYRAMVDIQADPEFVSKFDQPLEKAKDSIKALFKTVRDKTTGNPISDDIINAIDFTNTPVVDTILDSIEANGDKTTAKRIQRKIEELVDLNDKRNETLEEQKKNYKELLENKKKESFNKEAEGEGRIIKHLENISQAKDATGNSIFPFLSKIAAPDNASQLQVDQVNNHNEMVELMGKKLQTVFKMNSPEERAEVAVAAVASHYLSAQLKAATAQIASLKKELGKISNVSSETERTKPAPVQRNGNGTTVRAGEAVDAFFARR